MPAPPSSCRICSPGVTSFFAALCYAELGAMVPVAGSAYTYAYATMGKLFAWIIGFALIFEYGISAAPVAQQFSAAIQDVFKSVGLALPAWAQQSNLMLKGPWWDAPSWDLAHSQGDIVGSALRHRFERVALDRHSRIGHRPTTSSWYFKISALVVFVIAGHSLFHAANLHNFNPSVGESSHLSAVLPIIRRPRSRTASSPSALMSFSVTSDLTPRRLPRKSVRIRSTTCRWA